MLQDELASLSDNSHHLFSDGHHRLHETDPDAVISAIQWAIKAVKIRPESSAGLGLPTDALSLRSTPAVDQLLEELEVAYRAMDVERFVGLLSEDFAYRYTGLGLLQMHDGKLQRQILYGDHTTLAEQLATGGPAAVR